MDPNELLGKQGHTEETVLAHISILCSNVTQNHRHRLRTKKPSVFSNPLLFRETLKLLNTYQFKLAAKRFILFTLLDQVIYTQNNSMDLFDKSLTPAYKPTTEPSPLNVVKKEPNTNSSNIDSIEEKKESLDLKTWPPKPQRPASFEHSNNELPKQNGSKKNFE